MQELKNSSEAILTVENLTTVFNTQKGPFKAVDELSFSIERNKTMGIVGESGSGKSVTALTVMGLLPEIIAEVQGGIISFKGNNLLTYSNAQMRNIRGNEISMIFQEPMTSLNPVLSVGYQLTETIKLHQGLSKSACYEKAIQFLDYVRIPDASERMSQYPYQMSGGMRQRIMIAMALSCNPTILIADEPTTALDVTVQAQILSLIADLQDKTGTAVVFITHDLGVVAEVADKVIVMYAGRCVEEAPIETIFNIPLHPYTVGLLTAVPRMGSINRRNKNTRLREIPGSVPSPFERLSGCSFFPRCPLAVDRCRTERPPLIQIENGHKTACWETQRIGELVR